jgi:hypothetical protein
MVPTDAGSDSAAPVDTGSEVDSSVPDTSVMETGPTPYSVPCGVTTTCTAPAEFCCASGPTSQMTDTCTSNPSDCSGPMDTPVYCTSSSQCGAGELCCGQINGTVYGAITCQGADAGGNGPCGGGNQYVFCDPSVPSDCPPGTGVCSASTRLDGFYRCN